MGTLTTAQKIERMESELAELKRQQAEETKAKEQAETERRNQELDIIKNQINAFNKRYGTEYMLSAQNDLILLSAFDW